MEEADNNYNNFFIKEIGKHIIIYSVKLIENGHIMRYQSIILEMISFVNKIMLVDVHKLNIKASITNE